MIDLGALREDLAELPPGPELAALLASVDRETLSGADRVRLLQARSRQLAHDQAELVVDLYAVSLDEEADGAPTGNDPRQASRYPWAEAEVAFALRWTRHAAGGRLEQARTMVEDYPAMLAALSAGLIDMPKALVIADGVQELDLDLGRPIVDKVLDKAPEQTTGEIRARLRRMVLAADPEIVKKRAQVRRRSRRVQIFLGDDQLASIAGYELPPERVAAGWERLNAIARAAKAAGDNRKIDQLRADAMLDLLVGDGIATGGPITDPYPTDDPTPTDPEPAASQSEDANIEDSEVEDSEVEELKPYWSAGFDRLPATPPGCPRCRATTTTGGPMPAPRRGVVDIQIPLTTLAGLDELPAELVGFGPMLADVARQLIEENPELRWRYSVYDKIHELVGHGAVRHRPDLRRRRPTASVAAFVRARHQTCTAPGCRVPSRSCDLDHGTMWQHGGDSDTANLDPKCRGHHLFRHYPGTEVAHTAPGFVSWTTPRGHQYLTRPTPPLYADPPPSPDP